MGKIIQNKTGTTRFVLASMLAITLLPSASATAREKVSAAEYTYATCQKILKDDLDFQRLTIRGAVIDKLKNAMQSQLAEFNADGIFFEQEDLVTGPSGTVVNLNKASFTSIERFFDSAKTSKAVPPQLLNAIESAFMQRIGAVVYEPAAQDLYEIYMKYRQAKNISGPFPFEVQLTTPNYLDFRETSAAALERFLEIIDGADDYAKTRPVQIWLLKVREFLVEAKARDLTTAAPDEQAILPNEVSSGLDQFYLSKPLTAAQAARIAAIRAARAKLRANILGSAGTP